MDPHIPIANNVERSVFFLLLFPVILPSACWHLFIKLSLLYFICFFRLLLWSIDNTFYYHRTSFHLVILPFYFLSISYSGQKRTFSFFLYHYKDSVQLPFTWVSLLEFSFATLKRGHYVHSEWIYCTLKLQKS